MDNSSEYGEQEVVNFYQELYEEEGRLLRKSDGILEFARSQELIRRHLPSSPGVVLDVGGGPGVYSCWLAREGYEVHLIDPVPKHLEQARLASKNQPQHPIASISQGDARSLTQSDESCDAILLMGPLYHLQERPDRLTALREAHRALRPGGLVFAMAINRFIPLIGGLMDGAIEDPYFVDIVKEDMLEGRHLNPENDPKYFTTAYLHRPEELEAEVQEAGFSLLETAAVQGPGWLAHDFESRWADPERREQLLDLIRTVEHEIAMMGVSHHFMTIAEKP